MASQLLGIKTRFTNDLGSPLVGGQVYTYFAGTSTNQDSYSDAALTVPNTNPVILDDTGSADIFLKGSYRIRVFDKSGRFIEEQDNVTQAASQGDATELTNKVNAVESGLFTANTEINKVKLDTGITVTTKHVDAITRNLSEKNDDFIDIRDFTLPTDADHTAGLQAAAQAALDSKKVLTGAGTYYIKSGDVSFRFLELALGACTFVVDNAYMIIMGGHAGSALNPNQVIGNVRNPTFNYNPETFSNPTIRVIGAKNQYIKIGFVQYLQLWMSTDPATYPKDASTAYSTFDIAYAIKIAMDTDPRYADGSNMDGASSQNQWCNENVFNLSKCTGFYMRGSYSHNHNIINGGSFEGASIIRLENAKRNHFLKQRFESTSLVIYFGEKTDGNIIEQSLYGDVSNWWLTSGAITDLGRLNSVRTVYDSKANKRELFTLANTDTVYNNHIGSYKRGASAKYIKSETLAYSVIADTELFRLRTKDYLMLDVDADTGAFYQAQIYLYDANKQLLKASTAELKTETPMVVNTAIDAYTSNFSQYLRFSSLDDRVVYARLRILSGNTLVSQKARSISAYIVSLRTMLTNDFQKAVMAAENTLVSSKPTQFIGKLGDIVRNIDGTTYFCSHMMTTVITSSASTTSINVGSLYDQISKSTKIGDMIGIELDNNAVHWTTVASLSGTNIMLTTAMPSAISNGNLVYISRLTDTVAPTTP